MRFVVFYLLGGIAALALQTAIDPDADVPSLGASGAIAGVLGGYLLLYPRAKVLTLIFLFFFFTFIELPALLFLGIWFAQQALFGSSTSRNPTGGGGGVAYFAHIGGFVFGLLAIKLFADRRKPTGSRCSRTWRAGPDAVAIAFSRRRWRFIAFAGRRRCRAVLERSRPAGDRSLRAGDARVRDRRRVAASSRGVRRLRTAPARRRGARAALASGSRRPGDAPAAAASAAASGPRRAHAPALAGQQRPRSRSRGRRRRSPCASTDPRDDRCALRFSRRRARACSSTSTPAACCGGATRRACCRSRA